MTEHRPAAGGPVGDRAVGSGARTLVYAIDGRSYDSVGAATARFKTDLRRLGLAPEVMRRVIIAAYEAEANAVIHAGGGCMTAGLGRSHVCVEVRDEGPGIENLRAAMREGYSSAPEEARQLGFGAGMGLPNIKKNSDRLSIETGPGRGTRVIFEVELTAARAEAGGRNSLEIRAEHCRECLACLRACPTEAIRVRRKVPAVLEHLCVDCTACLAACRSGALCMQSGVRGGKPEADRLIVPAAFLSQFWPRLTPAQALNGLNVLGYRRVVVGEPWEQALADAVLSRSGREAAGSPAISPVCPAAVNLVRTRFPALVDHIAPLLSPLEAALRELGGDGLAVVAVCPAQRSAVMEAGLPAEMIADPVSLGEDILRLGASNAFEPAPILRPTAECDRAPESRTLRVEGMAQVIRIMEMAENGLLPPDSLLEPYACDGGCFGSPLLGGQAHLNCAVWRRMPVRQRREATAIVRGRPLRPRRGQRLDPDMERAVVMLGEIQDIADGLPGRDCACCGAPSCMALAEDVAAGRAELSDCPFPADGGGASACT